MEFKKLSEVQLVDGAMNTANVLIEENGEIKRVPKTEVGGTGFPTVIVEHATYTYIIEELDSDEGMLGSASAQPADGIVYSCSGITFEEAYEEMRNGGIINVMMKGFMGEFPVVMQGMASFIGRTYNDPCIYLMFIDNSAEGNMLGLFWTADGISENPPGSISGGEEPV